MTPSTITHGESGMPELDRTLALLAAVEPRAGLEQRVHARLAAAPVLPWYRRLGNWRFAAAPHRLAPAHWMLATASVIVVASAVTLSVHHERPTAPSPTFFATRAPRPAQQPVAAAAAVAVPNHPLPHTQTRHRGSHRAFRAQHERSILPRGTVAPLHPQMASPTPQH